MQQKHLAILAGSLRVGGAETAVRNVIHSLPEDLRRSTTLVLITGPGSPDSPDLGVPIVSLRATNVLSAAWRLRALLRDIGAVAVHAHLNQAIVAAGLATVLTRRKLVAYIHSFGTWKQRPRLRDRARILAERLIVNLVADRVVYVSGYVKSLHESRLGYRSSSSIVIPNIIRTTARSTTSGVSALNLITIARVEPVKGIDWVLQSGEVRAALRNATWTVAGAGSQLSALRQFASENGRKEVLFLGQRSDIDALLEAADAFILPSRSEGLPVALLEACSAGLPIIATDVGAVREVVRDGVNGFLVQPGDGAALANAIHKMRDPELRRRFSLASRELYEAQFSADKIIASHISILKGTLR